MKQFVLATIMLTATLTEAAGLSADYAAFLKSRETEIHNLDRRLVRDAACAPGQQARCLRDVLLRAERPRTARELTAWFRAIAAATHRDARHFGNSTDAQERADLLLLLLERADPREFRLQQMIPLTASDYVEWTALLRAEDHLLQGAGLMIIGMAASMHQVSPLPMSMRERIHRLVQSPPRIGEELTQHQAAKLAHFIDMDLRRDTCHADARLACPEMSESECHQMHRDAAVLCGEAEGKPEFRNPKDLKNYWEKFRRCQQNSFDRSMRQKYPACPVKV